MLVLTRKPKERIMVGDDVEITLLSAAGGKVRLGIQAPSDVPVYRTEIYAQLHRKHAAAGASANLGSGLADAVPLPSRPPGPGVHTER